MYIHRLPAIVGLIARPAMFLSVFLSVFLSAATIPSALNAADAEVNARSAQIAQAPDARRALVQRVQESLIRLGYDPGPADGVVGDRTTRSVQAFQKQKGLTADGNVSEALYLMLVSSVEAAARKAESPKPAVSPIVSPAVSSAPLPATAGRSTGPITGPTTGPSVVINLTNSRWAIVDSNGARASLMLLNDGKVGGVESPDFWRWQLQDGGIRIMYDNKVGGQVTRRGRIVSENEIRGDANSSRGLKWTWTATRLR